MNSKYWSVVVASLCLSNALHAQIWMLSTAPGLHWKGVASSADGTKLVAVIEVQANTLGVIYRSTNSGATWDSTSSPNLAWQCVASSADGSRSVAASEFNTGTIYLSTDSGMTWASTTAPHASWASAASSADGSKLIVAGGLFLMVLPDQFILRRIQARRGFQTASQKDIGEASRVQKMAPG